MLVNSSVCMCECVTSDFRSVSVCVRMMLNTAWDRLLSSFILVAATVRDLFPSDIRDSMSCQQTNTRLVCAVLYEITCFPWLCLESKGRSNDKVPCSRPQPGGTGRPRKAPSLCALSLSEPGGFCRGDGSYLFKVMLLK